MKRLTLRHIHDLIHVLLEKVEIIMGTQADAVVELRALKAQVARNRIEVLAKIAALEEASHGNTTPEMDVALSDLKDEIQGSDDDVPGTDGRGVG